MNRLCALIVTCLMLSSCTTANPVDVQARLDSWIGQDSDRLVGNWGPPDRSYEFRNGNRVLEYERNRVDTYGGWNAPHGNVVVGSHGQAIGVGVPIWADEPRISVRRCLIKFETDRNRIIRHTSFAGPNCAYAIGNGKGM